MRRPADSLKPNFIVGTEILAAALAPYNPSMPAPDLRPTARAIFADALAQSTVARAFSRFIYHEADALRIGDQIFHLQDYARIFVVSIGKAGESMAQAFAARAEVPLQGVVVTPEPGNLTGFQYFRGGHPTPTAESVRAAETILGRLPSLEPNTLVVFLLSGGASSMVEQPLDPALSLADLITTYRVLVHSGAPIAEINAIRKHLSAVKGGRMALAAAPRRQVSLLVSDVPDQTPDALASGPTMPDSTTVEACYTVAEKYSMTAQFPASVASLFRDRRLQETPKSSAPAFQNSHWLPVLSNAVALQHAADAAARSGFAVVTDNSCDDWDYNRAADYLLSRLRELRQSHPRVCLLSGGEVTVRVTNGGVGGRNQQFALTCAQKIAGAAITVLSAGTDGIDGNSPAAGAVVDGSTLSRASAQGLDVAQSLAAFNAYPLFASLGDAIHTGPTGNNLRDLRILLAE